MLRFTKITTSRQFKMPKKKTVKLNSLWVLLLLVLSLALNLVDPQNLLAADNGSYSSFPVGPGGTVPTGSASVGSPTSGSLLISNGGVTTMTVNVTSLSGPYTITSPAMPVIINGGASALLSIQCIPSAPGNNPGTLTLSTDDILNPAPS